jgi:poly(3-hydroxybutyrate) depolymerase
MVIWLHPAGGLKEKELLNEWKPICEALDLILVAPKSAEPARWQRTELEFIRKAADDVISKYNIDRTRIVAAGQEAGGAMAFLLAAANRELVRGVATVNTSVPPGLKMPTSEPVQRLAFFAVNFKEPPAGWNEAVKRLREAKHPVTELKVGDNARALKSEEWQQLARWIDTLDRS